MHAYVGPCNVGKCVWIVLVHCKIEGQTCRVTAKEIKCKGLVWPIEQETGRHLSVAVGGRRCPV